MPPEPRANAREASNIDHGGTEASVKVSVVPGPSEGKGGNAPESQSAMSRSKFGSGFGNAREGQYLKGSRPSREQLSAKERDELVSSIV
jgi:hypothetical protein